MLKSKRFHLVDKFYRTWYKKYLKDIDALIDKNEVSSEDLRKATEGLYLDFWEGKITKDDFFWLISGLYQMGVLNSRGFGEVYSDTNVLKALRIVADPVPYIRNPTHEDMIRLVRDGIRILGLKPKKF